MEEKKHLSIKKIALWGVGGLVVLFVAVWIINFTTSSFTVGSNDSISPPTFFAEESVMDFGDAAGAPASQMVFNQKANTVSRGSGGVDVSIPDSDRSIIKSGNLSVVVEDVDQSIKDIRSIAESAEGFLDGVSVNEYGQGKKRGNVTIRVPSDSFENVFDEVKNISIRTTSESISNQDVTDQLVDLGARFDNLLKVEEQYVEVLERANTIEDILKVRQVLDRTREEIEVLDAQITHLNRRVALSSISVGLVSEDEVEVLGIVWSPLTRIKLSFNDFVSSLTDYVDSVIAIIFKLPVLLLWLATIGLLLWLAVKLFFALKKRFWKRHAIDTNENQEQNPNSS